MNSSDRIPVGMLACCALTGILLIGGPGARMCRAQDGCGAHDGSAPPAGLPGPPASAPALLGGPQAGVPGGVPLLPLLPPLRVSGDTHAHIQPCAPAAPDLSTAELLAQHQATETQVVFAQIRGTLHPDLPDFITHYAPLVTGAEDPVSLLPVEFPSAARNVTLYFQYFWKTLPGCESASGGRFCASDAIAVTVQ